MGANLRKTPGFRSEDIRANFFECGANCFTDFFILILQGI